MNVQYVRNDFLTTPISGNMGSYTVEPSHSNALYAGSLSRRNTTFISTCVYIPKKGLSNVQSVESLLCEKLTFRAIAGSTQGTDHSNVLYVRRRTRRCLPSHITCGRIQGTGPINAFPVASHSQNTIFLIDIYEVILGLNPTRVQRATWNFLLEQTFIAICWLTAEKNHLNVLSVERGAPKRGIYFGIWKSTVAASPSNVLYVKLRSQRGDIAPPTFEFTQRRLWI